MDVIYGISKAYIGIDQVLINCPCCEADNFADVMVSSNYYHIFYIPMFPFEKEANLICTKCGLKRNNVPFEAGTFKNFAEIKGKFKHPMYTYVFIVLFLIITTFAILFDM